MVLTLVKIKTFITPTRLKVVSNSLIIVRSLIAMLRIGRGELEAG